MKTGFKLLVYLGYALHSIFFILIKDNQFSITNLDVIFENNLLFLFYNLGSILLLYFCIEHLKSVKKVVAFIALFLTINHFFSFINLPIIVSTLSIVSFYFFFMFVLSTKNKFQSLISIIGVFLLSYFYRYILEYSSSTQINLFTKYPFESIFSYIIGIVLFLFLFHKRRDDYLNKPCLNNKYQRYNLDRLRLIGAGGNGDFYYSWDNERNRPIGVKILNKENTPFFIRNDKERQIKTDLFIKEVLISSKLPRHGNLSELYDCFLYREDNSELPLIIFIYKLEAGSNLYDYMKTNDFSKEDAILIFWDILNGLVEANERALDKQYSTILKNLNQKNNHDFFHGDIHLKNIMYTPDRRAILIDWGQSFSNRSRKELYPNLPPEFYPNTINELDLSKCNNTEDEIQKQLDYAGQKSDVFSLGVLLYYFITNAPPFSDLLFLDTNEFIDVNDLYHNKVRCLNDFIQRTTVNQRKFILSMLSFFPKNRPNLKETKEFFEKNFLNFDRRSINWIKGGFTTNYCKSQALEMLHEIILNPVFLTLFTKKQQIAILEAYSIELNKNYKYNYNDQIWNEFFIKKINFFVIEHFTKEDFNQIDLGEGFFEPIRNRKAEVEVRLICQEIIDKSGKVNPDYFNRNKYSIFYFESICDELLFQLSTLILYKSMEFNQAVKIYTITLNAHPDPWRAISVSFTYINGDKNTLDKHASHLFFIATCIQFYHLEYYQQNNNIFDRKLYFYRSLANIIFFLLKHEDDIFLEHISKEVRNNCIPIISREYDYFKEHDISLEIWLVFMDLVWMMNLYAIKKKDLSWFNTGLEFMEIFNDITKYDLSEFFSQKFHSFRADLQRVMHLHPHPNLFKMYYGLHERFSLVYSTGTSYFLINFFEFKGPLPINWILPFDLYFVLKKRIGSDDYKKFIYAIDDKISSEDPLLYEVYLVSKFWMKQIINDDIELIYQNAIAKLKGTSLGYLASYFYSIYIKDIKKDYFKAIEFIENILMMGIDEDLELQFLFHLIEAYKLVNKPNKAKKLINKYLVYFAEKNSTRLFTLSLLCMGDCFFSENNLITASIYYSEIKDLYAFYFPSSKIYLEDRLEQCKEAFLSEDQ